MNNYKQFITNNKKQGQTNQYSTNTYNGSSGGGETLLANNSLWCPYLKSHVVAVIAAIFAYPVAVSVNVNAVISAVNAKDAVTVIAVTVITVTVIVITVTVIVGTVTVGTVIVAILIVVAVIAMDVLFFQYLYYIFIFFLINSDSILLLMHILSTKCIMAE